MTDRPQRTAARASHSAEPNVTPMIDVLLVLLIVFMLAITKQVEEQWPHTLLDAQLPEPSTGGGDAQIVLEVGPGGSYAINREPVPAGRLGARLAAIYAGRPTKVIFVKGDGGAKYHEVVTAMDVARGAGVRVLAFAPAR